MISVYLFFSAESASYSFLTYDILLVQLLNLKSCFKSYFFNAPNILNFNIQSIQTRFINKKSLCDPPRLLCGPLR